MGVICAGQHQTVLASGNLGISFLEKVNIFPRAFYTFTIFITLFHCEAGTMGMYPSTSG